MSCSDSWANTLIACFTTSFYLYSLNVSVTQRAYLFHNHLTSISRRPWLCLVFFSRYFTYHIVIRKYITWCYNRPANLYSHDTNFKIIFVLKMYNFSAMSERPQPLKTVNRWLEGHEPWQIVTLTASSVLALVWAHSLYNAQESNNNKCFLV